MPAAGRRLLRDPQVLGLILLLVMVSLCGAWLWTRPDDLDKAIAEADRLDPGWRLEQILARRKEHAPPPEVNSARQVERVLERIPPDRLKDAPKDDRSSESGTIPRGVRLRRELAALPPEVRLSDEQVTGLRAELNDLRPAVMEARKLATMPVGQTAFQPAKNFLETTLAEADYSKSMRQVVRLLQHDAALRAHEGDLDGAVDSVRAILNTGRSIGDEPTTESQMFRGAIAAAAVESLQRVLGQGTPSEAALEQVGTELACEALEPRLLWSIQGERAGYFDLVGKLASGELPIDAINANGFDAVGRLKQEGVLPDTLGRAWYRHNQALGLKLMTQAVEVARKPDSARSPFWAEWNGMVHSQSQTGPLAHLWYAKVLSQKQAGQLANLLLPALWSESKMEQQIACKLQCAVVMVACERFRLAEKHWPVLMQDLVPRYLEPRMSVDPYSGQPLRLIRTEQGLTVYGLGEDKVDNGGKLHPRGSAMTGYDVGVRLFDPERRGRGASGPGD